MDKKSISANTQMTLPFLGRFECLLHNYPTDILNLFSETFGLRLNNRKTEALWIDANIGKAENLNPEKRFE